MSTAFLYNHAGVVAVVQLNGFVGLSFVEDRNSSEGWTAVIQHRDGFTKISIPDDDAREHFATAIFGALSRVSATPVASDPLPVAA